MMRRNITSCVFALFLAMMMPEQAAIAQWDNQPDGSQVTPDPWPKIVKQAGATYTLYQPQLDSWDGYNFAAHAAVSVLGCRRQVSRLRRHRDNGEDACFQTLPHRSLQRCYSHQGDVPIDAG